MMNTHCLNYLYQSLCSRTIDSIQAPKSKSMLDKSKVDGSRVKG